jgi:GMP synthase (glutamine-hydrolysing)
MLNKQRKGTIVRQSVREDGQFQVELNVTDCPLFKNMKKLENVLLTHGDSIGQLGENLIAIGTSESFIVACSDKEKPIYGVQFHPEVNEIYHKKNFSLLIKTFICLRLVIHLMDGGNEWCLREILIHPPPNIHSDLSTE